MERTTGTQTDRDVERSDATNWAPGLTKNGAIGALTLALQDGGAGLLWSSCAAPGLPCTIPPLHLQMLQAEPFGTHRDGLLDEFDA